MKKTICTIIIISLVLPFNSGLGAELAEKLAGRILLQVEQNGEAWYVAPDSRMRHFLGRPDDAFRIMREQGVGITNLDLKKIPVGLIEREDFKPLYDTDGDKLSDDLETALGTDGNKTDTDDDGFNDWSELKFGYNPTGPGNAPIDIGFSARQAGKILLQVERNGEAWYVNPENNRRYFLGRPDDAFAVMRFLGLGVSDDNLNDIIARTPGFLLGPAEKEIHELINHERLNNNLSALKWNTDLANVAREHSLDLAAENEGFTAFASVCDYPLIHHEGLDFGLYNSDRLHNRRVYYFSKSGENIALLSGATYRITYIQGDPVEEILEECDRERSAWDADMKSSLEESSGESQKISLIEQEIERRIAAYQEHADLTAGEINWRDKGYILRNMVQGWMDSPGHRRNILDADYDEAGIGLAYVNGYFIATQVFIKRASCGFQGGPCCEKEGYYPYCFVPLECADMICLAGGG